MNEYKIKHKDNVVRVKDISDGFIDKNATVCKVTDNGNGYTIKFPRLTSCEQDVYMSLDYVQADYLRYALNKFLGKQQ